MLKIGVRLPAAFDSAGEFLADARALESAGVDLLLLGEGDLESEPLLAALAAATERVEIHGIAGDTVRKLARGRLVAALEGWREAPFPEHRTAWRATLAQLEEEGAAGIILDMDPRLLDLLRNPDVEDDRADLQLAQG
ncbi:MAG: hypothetical protein ABI838_02260 [Chloroflexota bacterium]